MSVPHLLHTVLDLGGELSYDRTDTREGPLGACTDPAGHVFCVFVA